MKENFDVTEITDPKPPAKNHFSLYIQNRWIGLKAKPEKIGTGPIAGLDA